MTAVYATIERAYQEAMTEHRRAVEHARRSIGQIFRRSARR